MTTLPSQSLTKRNLSPASGHNEFQRMFKLRFSSFGGHVYAHFFLRNKFVRESGRAASISVKGPKIAAGRWQMVKVVCDQKTAYVEVDGVKGDAVPVSGDLFYPLYTAVGGGGKGDTFFAGRIKNLNIKVR